MLIIHHNKKTNKIIVNHDGHRGRIDPCTLIDWLNFMVSDDCTFSKKDYPDKTMYTFTEKDYVEPYIYT